MWHYINAETARPSLRHHETETVPRQPIGYPTQLFCRRLIDLAFHDSIQRRGGKPTQAAIDAQIWITTRTNWTRIPIEKRMEKWASPAPPREVRNEYAGSFDWACQNLCLNPDHIRTHGLALAHGRGSSQGRETWRRNRQGGPRA